MSDTAPREGAPPSEMGPTMRWRKPTYEEAVKRQLAFERYRDDLVERAGYLDHYRRGS